MTVPLASWLRLVYCLVYISRFVFILFWIPKPPLMSKVLILWDKRLIPLSVFSKWEHTQEKISDLSVEGTLIFWFDSRVKMKLSRIIGSLYSLQAISHKYYLSNSSFDTSQIEFLFFVRKKSYPWVTKQIPSI